MELSITNKDSLTPFELFFGINRFESSKKSQFKSIQDIQVYAFAGKETEIAARMFEVIKNKQADFRNFDKPKLDRIHKLLKWPSAKIVINNNKYLRYLNDYVLTISGHLVPIKSVINNGFVNKSELKDGLLGDEFEDVDGIPLGNKIPLLNLNEDVLTGLKIDSELQLFKDKTNNISLSDVMDMQTDDAIVIKAKQRLKLTLSKINKLTSQHFEENNHLKESKYPKLFITMGGSGSGKGHMMHIAKKLTNNNLVEASLDKSRYKSSIYKLLIKANHHADDYKVVEQFSNALRNSILQFAMEKNYNVLLDCSGVPYFGRYSKLVEYFSNAKYDVHILACDIPFYSNNQNDAYTRIINRFQNAKDQRALPWSVAITKHKLFPSSVIDASYDPKIKSLKLYDNSNQYPNLIAETSSKYIECASIKLLDDRFLNIYNKDMFLNILKKVLLNPKAKCLEEILDVDLKYLTKKDLLNS